MIRWTECVQTDVQTGATRGENSCVYFVPQGGGEDKIFVLSSKSGGTIIPYVISGPVAVAKSALAVPWSSLMTGSAVMMYATTTPKMTLN